MATPALDLPGGFNFVSRTTGGIPPYSVTYTSNDPYSVECHCPIFSVAGNHTVRALVSDSLDAAATASTNVTLYPVLSGSFHASVESGAAPLIVNFTAALSGGHLPNASRTHWEFGDGANGTGSLVNHTFLNPGLYVVTALASDGFGGHASAAFLIDATPASTPPSTVLTAEITPALDVPVGAAVDYFANATGPDGPYLLHWTLGPNGSAFGSRTSSTYPYLVCASPPSCSLSIGLGAEDGNHRWLNVTFPLDPAQLGNATALGLSVRASTTRGATPFVFRGIADTVGMGSVSVAWTFGDGSTGPGEYGNHTYLTPGNYTVTAVATDPYGDRLIQDLALVVTGVQRYSPTVAASSNVTNGLAPLSVGFQAAASGGAGGPFEFTWSFGDGKIAAGASVSHTYGSAGEFIASATATDRLGDPASFALAIDVYGSTSLGLSVAGLPESVAPGASLPLSVHESAACGAQSVPNCTSARIPFRTLVEAAGVPPPSNGSIAGSGHPMGASGYSNFTLIAPNSAGKYVLYLWANGSGFVGSARTPFTVLNGTSPVETQHTPGVPYQVLRGDRGRRGGRGRRDPARRAEAAPGAEGPRYPFTTPSGRRRATRRVSPAPSATRTTSSTSL